VVTDGSGRTASCDQTITVNGHAITGTVRYHNAFNTPLKNVVVELWQGGSKVYPVSGQIKTNSSGQYSFSQVCSGTYEVRLSSSEETGSINSTDAAQDNNWFTNQSSIEKARFMAGDVSGDGSIIAYDAQRIQGYFVQGLAFDRPAWCFWRVGQTIAANPWTGGNYPTLTVTTSSMSNINYYGIGTGDFSRSFNPAVKDGSANLQLTGLGNIRAEANMPLELPVFTTSDLTVSAVSMILNFPEELVQVTGVSMAFAEGSLDWAVNGNELRIGWNTGLPVSLAAFDRLLTINLLTSAGFTYGKVISFTVANDPLNELADGYFEVVSGATLATYAVEASTYGIDELPDGSSLNLANFPNPFYGYTYITYTLPFEGQVWLEIASTLGTRVRLLVDERQTAGDYKLRFDTYELHPGVYTATLRLKNKGNEVVKTIRIVRAW
jgi:hypothetical protein